MNDIEGSEPDGISDEIRSERARAANEFQIVEDLQAAQFAEIATDLKK